MPVCISQLGISLHCLHIVVICTYFSNDHFSFWRTLVKPKQYSISQFFFVVAVYLIAALSIWQLFVNQCFGHRQIVSFPACVLFLLMPAIKHNNLHILISPSHCHDGTRLLIMLLLTNGLHMTVIILCHLVSITIVFDKSIMHHSYQLMN